MKLAYICTNYNNSCETIVAIESLFSNQGHNLRCIVVDNNSMETEKTLLKERFAHDENVVIILNEQNLGYFNGLNVGIAHMQDSKEEYKYAVIGNNDLVFSDHFVGDLEKSLKLFEKYPIVSPSIETMDGSPQNPHVISDVSRFRRCLYDIYFSNYFLGLFMMGINYRISSITRRGDEKFHEIRQEITQGHGACYLVGPLFFSEFEKLDAPTFLFGEELFLSKQLERKGYRILYEPSIHVTHVCHAAVNSLPSRMRWKLAQQAYHIEKQYL